MKRKHEKQNPSPPTYNSSHTGARTDRCQKTGPKQPSAPYHLEKNDENALLLPLTEAAGEHRAHQTYTQFVLVYHDI